MVSRNVENFIISNTKSSFTLEELSNFQTLSMKSLSFSMTLSCPLSCKHCIVGAGPDNSNSTMTIEHAKFYASQMKEIYKYGIKVIGFTGGEPTMAHEQVAIISEAAAKAGIYSGIVTSGYFAKDEKAVKDMVESLPYITVWDLSTDKYHEKYVSRDKIRLSYETIKNMDRIANIRFAFHTPMCQEDQELFEYLQSFADPSDIFCQKIRKFGRASNMDVDTNNPIFEQTLLVKPCTTQGMVIRYDGSISPCCCSLIEEREHPFQFGSALDRKIIDIHRDYMKHPLFQQIRVLGFGELIRLTIEKGFFDEFPEELPNDICDLCPIFFTNKKIAEYLNDRASRPENILKIAVMAKRILGESYMLEDAIATFSPIKDTIEGYEVALDLLENPDKYTYYL